MKIIVSQDREKVFTMGSNNLINVAPIEVGENPKITLFSIGISGISVGVFKEKSRARHALNEVIKFLCGDGVKFTIPADSN